MSQLAQGLTSDKHGGGLPYEPRGPAAELQHLTNPELVISGPAGTGKSRACLEKVHRLATTYAGLRALIVRKTRASLTQSGLYTFERFVLGPGHPLAAGPQRQFRQAYVYPNGSEVIVGGLDQATRPHHVNRPYWSCPIPPMENRLSLPIRAGERKPIGSWDVEAH